MNDMGARICHAVEKYKLEHGCVPCRLILGQREAGWFANSGLDYESLGMIVEYTDDREGLSVR